jgi:hypothetical protein
MNHPGGIPTAEKISKAMTGQSKLLAWGLYSAVSPPGGFFLLNALAFFCAGAKARSSSSSAIKKNLYGAAGPNCRRRSGDNQPRRHTLRLARSDAGRDAEAAAKIAPGNNSDNQSRALSAAIASPEQSNIGKGGPPM